MDPQLPPPPSTTSSSSLLDDGEALNAALALKLSKLRGFREVLDQKSRALQALEQEKKEREALLGPLLEQVEELKTRVAQQRAEIEAMHEEDAHRSRYVEGEVAQLREEVKRQKAAGKALEGMRKDYRLCQEHSEAFLTTLIRLRSRRRSAQAQKSSSSSSSNFSTSSSSSPEAIAGEEDVIGVEQQALLDTFFPPSLTPSSASIPSSSSSSPSRRKKTEKEHKQQRSLWTSLRVLVEEVVSLLGELHHSQNHTKQIRIERDTHAIRAEEADAALRIALGELEETRGEREEGREELRVARGEIDEMKKQAKYASSDIRDARAEIEAMRGVMRDHIQSAMESKHELSEMREVVEAHALRAEAANSELRETRVVVGELEKIAGNLRESMGELEGAREQLKEELRERDEFLVALVGRMKVEEEEEEGREEGEEEGGAAEHVPSDRQQPPPLPHFPNSSSSFLPLQQTIHSDLTHLLARLQLLHALHADTTSSSYRREGELQALHQALKEMEDQRNEEMEAAREGCEQQQEQQEQLLALVEQVEGYEVVMQEKDQILVCLEEELMKRKEENERMGKELARCQAGREGERRLLQQRGEEAGAWKRQAVKLQQEVGEWHEKMKRGGGWGGGTGAAGAAAHGFGSSSSSSGENRRFL